MADSVVHFEIPADDTDRASTFYREALGWNINAMPEMGYTILGTAPSGEDGRPTEPGSINGGMFKREKPFSGPVVTVGVDDIDAALGKIESAGGKQVMDKQEVGDMGFAAYFEDTEGNLMGLWESKM